MTRLGKLVLAVWIIGAFLMVILTILILASWMKPKSSNNPSVDVSGSYSVVPEIVVSKTPPAIVTPLFTPAVQIFTPTPLPPTPTATPLPQSLTT